MFLEGWQMFFSTFRFPFLDRYLPHNFEDLNPARMIHARRLHRRYEYNLLNLLMDILDTWYFH